MQVDVRCHPGVDEHRADHSQDQADRFNQPKVRIGPVILRNVFMLKIGHIPVMKKYIPCTRPMVYSISLTHNYLSLFLKSL